MQVHRGELPGHAEAGRLRVLEVLPADLHLRGREGRARPVAADAVLPGRVEGQPLDGRAPSEERPIARFTALQLPTSLSPSSVLQNGLARGRCICRFHIISE